MRLKYRPYFYLPLVTASPQNLTRLLPNTASYVGYFSLFCVFIITHQGSPLGFYCRNELCMQLCVKKYTHRIKLSYELYC